MRAFAVLATLANLGAQRVVLALLDVKGELAAAIFVGTGVGLVVKYVLDKRWIFFDTSYGRRGPWQAVHALHGHGRDHDADLLGFRDRHSGSSGART